MSRQLACGPDRSSLRRGLTQEALAHRAGLHPTYVSSLECGHRNVSLENIVRLAHALEMPVAELMEGLDGVGERGQDTG